MNTLDRLKALAVHAVYPNEPLIVISKNDLDIFLKLAEAVKCFVDVYDGGGAAFVEMQNAIEPLTREIK